MGSIINTLKELEVGRDDYVYLNYEDSASVWHVSENYITEALGETTTANMLATLLATQGVTIYSRYDEDILAQMRDHGLLKSYERGGWFEDYLTEAIRIHAYDYDLLTISTERHDHKRGTCAVASNVKIRAGELFDLVDDADALVAGWDVAVQTVHGTLAVG